MSLENKLGVGTWTPDPKEKNGLIDNEFDVHYEDDEQETHSYLDYTANLDLPHHKLPIFDEIKTCDPRYIVKTCNCKRTIVPSGCMSTRCPTCAPATGKRRAKKVSKRFLGEHKRVTLLYTVFTIPEKLREKYEDKKTWQLLRRRVWKMLKAKFGGRYGLEASHPVGDSDDNKFHPHFNFLWMQQNGFRPFLKLDELRKEFGKLLGINTVDVYHQFSSKLKKIMHWCRYVVRIFPGCHTWSGPTRWYGRYPKVKKTEEICCCEKCGEEFEFVGFLDKCHVTDFYASLDDRAPPWEDDSLIYRLNRKS